MKSMNPPFSNERLRNLTDEFIQTEEEKWVQAVADGLAKQILEKAYSDSPNAQWGEQLAPHNGNVGKHKLKFQLPLSAPNTRCRQLIAQRGLLRYTERILTVLHQRFPEMKILVDPLQTYILFDWS